MILTIGMIVKNEEKYLRSCLEAISPILLQVDSELIIADTGSSDSTMEIAKEFTDRVFHFEWCDDFSAARNATLEKAQGEWYMALDADEIFADTSEIVDFFNSEDYKKYNSATYVIRNSNVANREVYTDFDAFRMTKVIKDIRYTNRIHETLPLYAPTKKLSALANHYGYLLDGNTELIKKKSQRNLNLLFSELDNDPHSCKIYLEIGQTYSMAANFEPALEYLTKGLQCAKEQNHNLLNVFVSDIARVHYAAKQFATALSFTEGYFSKKKSKSEIDLPMYYIEAASSMELKKYKEAIAAYQKYIKLFKEYRKGTLLTKDSILHEVSFTDNYNYRAACVNLVRACMYENDYVSANRFLTLLPLSDWHEHEPNFKNRLNLAFDLMNATDNYSQLPVLFKQLSPNAQQLLQAKIEPFFETESKRDLILTEIAHSDLPRSDYIDLLNLRYCFYCSHSLTKEALETFISGVTEWSPLYADIICFALSYKLDIKFISAIINAYDLDSFLFSSRFCHFKNLPQLIFETAENNSTGCDINSQLWLSFLYLWALKSNQLSANETVSLFHSYARTIGEFLSGSFKEEFLSEEQMMLFPKYLRLGFHSSSSIVFWDNGEKSKYLNCLKTILKQNPELNSVITILLDDSEIETRKRQLGGLR